MLKQQNGIWFFSRQEIPGIFMDILKGKKHITMKDL